MSPSDSRDLDQHLHASGPDAYMTKEVRLGSNPSPNNEGNFHEYAERDRQRVDDMLRNASSIANSRAQESLASYRRPPSCGSEASIGAGLLDSDSPVVTLSPLPSTPPRSVSGGDDKHSVHASDFEDDDLYVQEGSQVAQQHAQNQDQVDTSTAGPACAPGLSEVKSIDSIPVEGEHVSSESEDEWERLSFSGDWD